MRYKLKKKYLTFGTPSLCTFLQLPLVSELYVQNVQLLARYLLGVVFVVSCSPSFLS